MSTVMPPTSDTDRSQRPNRWIPLSLRLFVVLMALAFFGGTIWIGVRIYRYHKLQAAIRDIERFGGLIYSERGGPDWLRRRIGDARMAPFDAVIIVDIDVSPLIDAPQFGDADTLNFGALVDLEQLDLSETRISDIALSNLRSLTSLESLGLSDTQITSTGLESLSKLTRLEQLFLGRTSITDAGIPHLRGMSGLKILSLTETRVTDKCLVHLGRLPSLQDLDLTGTQVTGTGFDHLKRLTNLEALRLERTQLTDAGLATLNGLPCLRFLDLCDTRITDSGLANLNRSLDLDDMLNLEGTGITDAGLAFLKERPLGRLVLARTRVTDDGLNELAGQTQLKELNVRDTQVTAAGIAKLQRHLPGLTIHK
jgi:Leucine Rich repeat